MPGKMDFDIQGLDILGKNLRLLDDRVGRRVLDKANRAAGAHFRKRLKAELPVSAGKKAHYIGGRKMDPQKLKDTIAILKNKNGGRRSDSEMRVGYRGLTQTYGHVIEFGNSQIPADGTWRKVFSREAVRAIKAAAEKLAVEITKEAGKLT